MLIQERKHWILFGLLFQIPNIFLLMAILIVYGIPKLQTGSINMISKIDINNLFLIAGGTIFLLVNIISIIFLIVGFTTKE